MNPVDVARDEARRMAAVLRELATDHQSWGQATLAADVPGSWADYAAGWDQGPVDELRSFYASRGRPAQVQVTPYHPNARDFVGFEVYDLDTVLVHTLEHTARPDPRFGFPEASPEDFRETQMKGFFGDEPPPGMLAITEAVAAHPRTHAMLVEHEGRVVGSGALEVFEDHGCLIAGAVFEEARGQGAQTALIRHRLCLARDLGLRYVTIASDPGGPTERNALRQGFTVALHQLRLRLG